MSNTVTSHPDLIDAERMHELKKLLQRNTSFSLDQLFRTFQESIVQSLADLQSALAPYEPSQIKKHLHRIRGSSLNIGASRLAEFARVIETTMTGDRTADLSPLVSQLEQLYAETIHALSEISKETF